ncbi:MAG: hypothetical protein ACLQUY_10625 [Ktedonobacterales bacterium]
MDLSGIVLGALIILVGLGIGAGVIIVLPGRDREQDGLFPQSGWLETASTDPESAPPGNAWKPETWYSEVADGTLFPNQPSPSFRVSADSSFQQAIARRDREDQVSNEPTRPYASISRRGNPAPAPPPGDTTPLDPIPDNMEALAQIPTVEMHTVPVRDNLPTTLKLRSLQRGHASNLSLQNVPNPEEPDVSLPADYRYQVLQPEAAKQSTNEIDVAATAELVEESSSRLAEVGMLEGEPLVAELNTESLVDPVDTEAKLPWPYDPM